MFFKPWGPRAGSGTQVALYYSVFHRILDLKTGLDFYPGPFLFYAARIAPLPESNGKTPPERGFALCVPSTVLYITRFYYCLIR